MKKKRHELQARASGGLALGKPENFSADGRLKGAAKMSELAAKSDANKRVLNLVHLYREKGLYWLPIRQ